MRKWVLVIITITAFYSCRQNNITEKKKEDIQSNRLQEINNTVHNMPSDTVEGKTIGSCWAKESHIYSQFEHINYLATEEDLVALTKNSKSNIRAYAFWFLAKKNTIK